jgi:hypothetical protein
MATDLNLFRRKRITTEDSEDAEFAKQGEYLEYQRCPGKAPEHADYQRSRIENDAGCGVSPWTGRGAYRSVMVFWIEMPCRRQLIDDFET